MNFATIIVAILFIVAASLPCANSLSWPLCEDGGNVWVTQRPQTDPQFPGADLFFFCDKGINLLGKSINNCLPQQEQGGNLVCDDAMVARAVCRLLGYDEVYNDFVAFSPADPNQVVVALTGEYCLREGQYSAQPPTPEELQSMPGKPCERLESIACYRSLENIAETLQMNIDVQTLIGDVGAPAVEKPPPAVESVIGGGGKRRMMMV